MELVRPWATWHSAPMVWAMAWHMPRKAEPKAMPAMVAALCIFSWALIFSSPGSALTEVARLSQISLAACSAMPSVKSLAYTEA